MALLLNIPWVVLGGHVMGLAWWLAIGHLTSALGYFVTIIGIPCDIQHIKLALIALAPVGMQVVPMRR